MHSSTLLSTYLKYSGHGWNWRTTTFVEEILVQRLPAANNYYVCILYAFVHLLEYAQLLVLLLEALDVRLCQPGERLDVH